MISLTNRATAQPATPPGRTVVRLVKVIVGREGDRREGWCQVERARRPAPASPAEIGKQTRGRRSTAMLGP
jgi:hypothetical protein